MDWSLPAGTDFASRGAVFVVLVVWVLSFVGTGTTFREARSSMRRRLPDLLAAARDQRVLVSRGGLTFAWWQPMTSGAWLLQEIASFPRGQGHGSRLLGTFLHLADEAHAPVALVCPRGRVNWYRRHGFRLGPKEHAVNRLGLLWMERPRRSATKHRGHQATAAKAS
ncbi:MAG: hypothetical protein QOF82_2898 [Frankiales bacterium]|jgi:GNAT superfamily N-acetyltransferase|nr:hypothetical protein [Frankiales bacterium]